MTKEQLHKVASTTSEWVSTFLLVALALIVLAAIAMPRPARAAEPVCKTYEEVVADYERFASVVPSMPALEVLSPEMLEASRLGAIAFGVTEAADATRGFRVPEGGGVYTIGLEVDGCMLPPFTAIIADDSSAPTPKLDSSTIHA